MNTARSATHRPELVLLRGANCLLPRSRFSSRVTKLERERRCADVFTRSSILFARLGSSWAGHGAERPAVALTGRSSRMGSGSAYRALGVCAQLRFERFPVERDPAGRWLRQVDAELADAAVVVAVFSVV